MLICKCCERVLVVKEGSEWVCFFCDPKNKTSWACKCVKKIKLT